MQIYAEGVVDYGVVQADLYHDQLFDLFDLLAENPQMARERPELVPPVRAHPYKSHVVIYKTEAPDILIIRVRHGSEDWMSGPE